MRTSNFSYKIMGGFLLLAVLAGCAAPTPSPTPIPSESPAATLAPTIDITPTMNAVRTEAVATVFAWQTQTAQAVPTRTQEPSATAAPTRTLAPLWTLTPTLTTAGCQVLSVSPDVNSPLAPNASFDGKWEVKNKGDGAWRANEVDIRYVSGTKFQTKVDAVDLTSDVDEEGTTTVIVDMQAPAQAGIYTANWAIYRGGSIVCGLGLTVKVQ
jgi:hypothetical protein